MYEKISTRSEGVCSPAVFSTHAQILLVLDDRIDEFAEIVAHHYNIADFGELSSTSGVS